MFLLFLPYLIQITLIIHVLKTGKNQFWVWLLIMVPIVGGLVYFFLEILPDLRRGRILDPDVLVSLVDKNATVKRLKEKVLLSDTVANKLELADEYHRLGDHAQAEELYRSLLTGLYRDDRSIQLKVAESAFARGDYPVAYQYFALADRQARLTATDARVHLTFAQAMADPASPGQSDLNALYQATKDAEAGYFMCLIFQKQGHFDKIRGIADALRLHHRNARGPHRARLGVNLKKIDDLVKANPI